MISAERIKGREFAKGVMDELAILFLVGVGVVLLLNAARNVFSYGVDDSDVSAWDRSGLRVRTDAKTGVQYLSDGSGGMVVRVGADGVPIVSK